MKTRYETAHGFADLWRVGDMWVPHMLYVQPRHRGKGEASELMRQMLKDADKDGIVVGLQVAGDIDGDNGMTDAQLTNWYQRMGFVQDERCMSPGRLIRTPAMGDGEQEKKR